jgi:hypothetical protein
MTEDEDRWPTYYNAPYQSIPKTDAHAIGVIALNYGTLELALRHIFLLVGNLNIEQLNATFNRLSNDARIKAAKELLATRDYPHDLNDLVLNFLDGYMECAERRHSIMHSHHAGAHIWSDEMPATILSRMSRQGQQTLFYADTISLRAMADEIWEYIQFGNQIIVALLEPSRRTSLPSAPTLSVRPAWLPVLSGKEPEPKRS